MATFMACNLSGERRKSKETAALHAGVSSDFGRWRCRSQNRRRCRFLTTSSLGSAPYVGNKRGPIMLWTIFVILLVLWLVGVVSSYTLGGFIHILLVLALLALIVQLLTGRRAV